MCLCECGHEIFLQNKAKKSLKNMKKLHVDSVWMNSEYAYIIERIKY